MPDVSTLFSHTLACHLLRRVSSLFLFFIILQYKLCIDGPSPPPKITLVWTDKEGNPGAGKLLVNDLDLKVGSVWGNNGKMYASTESLVCMVSHIAILYWNQTEIDPQMFKRDPTSEPDRTNTVEQVILRSAQKDQQVDIVVIAAALNAGAQPYALVVTGNVHLCENDPVRTQCQDASKSSITTP